MILADDDTLQRRAPQSPPGRCWDCGGPCLTYKGSAHGWRCAGCVDNYLDQGAAAYRERGRQRALFDHNAAPRRVGGRRHGDGLAAGHAAAPSATTTPNGKAHQR